MALGLNFKIWAIAFSEKERKVKKSNFMTEYFPPEVIQILHNASSSKWSMGRTYSTNICIYKCVIKNNQHMWKRREKSINPTPKWNGYKCYLGTHFMYVTQYHTNISEQTKLTSENLTDKKSEHEKSMLYIFSGGEGGIVQRQSMHIHCPYPFFLIAFSKLFSLVNFSLSWQASHFVHRWVVCLLQSCSFLQN